MLTLLNGLEKNRHHSINVAVDRVTRFPSKPQTHDGQKSGDNLGAQELDRDMNIFYFRRGSECSDDSRKSVYEVCANP